jgi:hypothetical protein
LFVGLDVSLAHASPDICGGIVSPSPGATKLVVYYTPSGLTCIPVIPTNVVTPFDGKSVSVAIPCPHYFRSGVVSAGGIPSNIYRRLQKETTGPLARRTVAAQGHARVLPYPVFTKTTNSGFFQHTLSMGLWKLSFVNLCFSCLTQTGVSLVRRLA